MEQRRWGRGSRGGGSAIAPLAAPVPNRCLQSAFRATATDPGLGLGQAPRLPRARGAKAVSQPRRRSKAQRHHLMMLASSPSRRAIAFSAALLCRNSGVALHMRRPVCFPRHQLGRRYNPRSVRARQANGTLARTRPLAPKFAGQAMSGRQPAHAQALAELTFGRHANLGLKFPSALTEGHALEAIGELFCCIPRLPLGRSQAGHSFTE